MTARAARQAAHDGAPKPSASASSVNLGVSIRRQEPLEPRRPGLERLGRRNGWDRDRLAAGRLLEGRADLHHAHDIGRRERERASVRAPGLHPSEEDLEPRVMERAAGARMFRAHGLDRFGAEKPTKGVDSPTPLGTACGLLAR